MFVYERLGGSKTLRRSYEKISKKDRNIREKRWKHFLLNLSFLYICFIIPFTKYTAQASSELSLLQSQEKEKLESFHDIQKEKIQLLQEAYDCIYYAIGDDNDYPFSYVNKEGEACGTYYDMFSFFAKELNIDFQMVNFDDYQVALGELEENKIQVLAGMLIPTTNQVNILEDNLLSDSSKITLSERIAKNNIILVSKVKRDIIMNRESVPNYYWGAEERILPFINQTELDGHTIAYNTFEELVQAINGDELQGLLIKESNYSFIVDNFLKDSLQKVVDITYPTEERFAYNAENATLNGVLDSLLSIYLDAHQGAKTESTDVINTLTLNDSQEDDTSKRHVIAISTYVFGVAAAVLIIFSASTKIKDIVIRKSRVKELESRLRIKPEVEYEKFYVDLKQGKITSNKHFKTLLNKRKRKSLRLKELSQLTGFDYELHYKNIVFLGEEEFTEEYSLYVKGEKHNFIESGIYNNGFMVTVLTKAH